MVAGRKSTKIESSSVVILNWERQSTGTAANKEPFGPYSSDPFNNLVETTYSISLPQYNNGKGVAWPGFLTSDTNTDHKRHMEGANYSFVDGHVKWYKPEAIKVVVEGTSPTFWAH
jgi:prepilin-type processing-associated H-X9-DG protein